MKRYFTFDTPPDVTTYHPVGNYHWMSLPGSGYVCVVDNSYAEPAPGWTALPHLLDQSAANFNGVTATLGAYVHPLTSRLPAPEPMGGALLTDTMFQVAKKLATINRHFHP